MVMENPVLQALWFEPVSGAMASDLLSLPWV
jgi:hypothetical protein